MDLIWQGLREGILLLIQGDREVLDITLRTLKISGAATLLSLLLGIPLGCFLALKRFQGRNAIITLIYTSMGLPPVVAGLWVSLLLWRSGPLGFLGLMYTPAAIVIAQVALAAPIITSLTIVGMQQIDPKLVMQLKSLGASRWQLWYTLIKEARLAIMAAVIAGFGGVVSEVGASMMVGGNIAGQTRVLTTAIVLEVSRGNFSKGIALSIVLLALAYIIIFILTLTQQRGKLHET
ncbi:ABC transporter permease [Calderihabitans maritimus]|uniref:Binding-protein-dependent transport system inner membrane protein n=1 Tax=Calderihabitans maritimus TaxID=1246530 RepID=A0A1Z5HV41_9FIRM|nr:ABC transporter permease [Calderihabitans maritimus]GAW93374.1 binding-protein-dependent transport system inner membrane protein [Calderihabitans maritimus]